MTTLQFTNFSFLPDPFFFLSASSNVDLKNPFIEQKNHIAQIYLCYFFKDRADCNSARKLCED